ncbi:MULTISPECIES: acyl-CoA dehydrogenase family protein [unclassified Achromobacter]|uniref:acyl-CoA dehydrogenase family protein n=1 Tax=unclassified Achromobacter TaxID=2626865 RepID=UPI000B51A2EE|nr:MULTISPECIES: acyl-CoA dehydrogenase family protein [unclassified Achromobacter]OWT73588.1 hypothetical protein CEY05_21000 [Achromobacter sp. HZ34]OWT79495.1 hypothetical protein CEY04_10980 [Achromobacter sp. HZ28]
MPFEPKTAFPGLLADSAARVAQDLAAAYPKPADPAVIAEMGWNAVLIPEALGGFGGEFADLASIVEALALQATDLPIITRCGVVPAMLAALADGARAQALLTSCAEGAVVLELGGPLSASDAVAPLALARADSDGGAHHVTGKTVEMPWTEDCTHVLLVCADVDDGTPMLACVDADRLRKHGGGAVFQTMDEVRVCVCEVHDLPLADDDVLASGADAKGALDAGWRVAVAATATDTVCAMSSVLGRTITYLLERQQFGQPLAQFQALRHDVARLYVSYEICRSLLQATLREMAASPAVQHNAGAFDLLGMYTSEAAIDYAETVIQLHGGMGMTREMPAARLATRLLANAMRFGDTLSHRQSLNRLRTRTAP